MIITTTETVPGRDIREILDVVSGNTIRSKNVGKDIGAASRAWSVVSCGATRRC